jgi:hypothetical protein
MLGQPVANESDRQDLNEWKLQQVAKKKNECH